eukprot:gene14619-14416_t
MGEISAESKAGFEALTPRERECLRLVARHHQSKEIARLLNISKSTVDKHIDRARERIGAADRRAAALALARGSDLVATVPEAHTAGLRDGLVSFPLPAPTQPFTVSMLWHPRLDADPAHRWLRGCLREVCG